MRFEAMLKRDALNQRSANMPHLRQSIVINED